jgi:hypothetical protein
MENGNVATGAAFGGGLFASSTVTPTTFQASTATEWGVQRFSTNTTTTGTAYVGGAFGTIPFTMATALPACFSAKVNLSANASPNIWRFGLQSGLSATPTDGVFLKADPATSANWICEVRSGNTPVNFTTSVATPTSAWTNLEWVKGEASDHYLMYADGVSLCDINATGVEPANRLDIFAGIIKTSGATVHQMDVDWVWYWQGTGPSKRASSNI